MGYTTDFRGTVKLDKPLTVAHLNYLKAFNQTRRMQRRAGDAAKMSDPIREATGLLVGVQGGYFVNGKGAFGQDRDDSVVNANEPPHGQPGLWCQWVPTDDGTGIEWDGGEKFYDYVEWMKYIITHFLKPWGYVANGQIEWRGEEWGDTGVIVVENNEVRAASGGS